MRMQSGKLYYGFSCSRCGKFQVLMENMPGLTSHAVAQIVGSQPSRCEDCGNAKVLAPSHIIRRSLEDIPKTQRSPASAPREHAPQKAMVLTREGLVWEYDVVFYQEAPWLVVGWTAIQGQSGLRPTRLISMSAIRYQDVDPPVGGQQYLLSDTPPASFFDAPTQQLAAAGHAVLDEPLLTFEIEKPGPRLISHGHG